jgi:hypothetical protein
LLELDDDDDELSLSSLPVLFVLSVVDFVLSVLLELLVLEELDLEGEVELGLLVEGDVLLVVGLADVLGLLVEVEAGALLTGLAGAAGLLTGRDAPPDDPPTLLKATHLRP